MVLHTSVLLWHLFIYNLGSQSASLAIQCRRMGRLVHCEFARLWKKDAVA